MKILHVLNHSPPQQVDGYAIRAENIVRAQAGRGWLPVVLTSPQQPKSHEDGVENVDGLFYYRTRSRGARRAPFVRQFQDVNQMAARIRAVAAVEHPDVIHAHSPCLWGKAAALAARRLRIPLVYEVRGFWEDAAVDLGKTSETSLRYRMSRALETRVARAADAVVTIGELLRKDLAARGIVERKMFVVPNGVDADAFVPRPADERLVALHGLADTIRIGYIGTLYPWEGIEDLVRAVPQIVASAPHARFLIVGGGAREDAVRNQIARLGLAPWVNFVGPVPHEDVIRYYSLLDILVYPRRRTRNTELVTPLKPLEAMAMEKAVLASDVGGLCELTAGETALRFNSGDPADLARQCLQLIASAEERAALGRRGRAAVLAHRHWPTLISRYEEVYAAASAAARFVTTAAPARRPRPAQLPET